MKGSIKRTVLLLALILTGMNQVLSLDASIHCTAFKSPSSNYLEVNLFIVGTSITYLPIDSTYFQGAVDVLLMIKKNEEIVAFDKYRLNSPITEVYVDFLDVKRFSLAKGEYMVEVELTDSNLEKNTRIIKQKVEVDLHEIEFDMSELQFISSMKKDTGKMSKNGYLFELLPFDYAHKTIAKLIFYTEIYNSFPVLSEDYTLRYEILYQSKRSKDTIALERTTSIIGHKKRSPKPIDPVLMQLDISKLPSGNYELLLEVRDKQNKLLAERSKTFQRSNPYLKFDDIEISSAEIASSFVEDLQEKELNYSLRAIASQVSDEDVQVLNDLIKKGSPEAQRSFLFSFWLRRNNNNPGVAYDDYMKVAAAVDKKFKSGFGYGFETDRGLTYMKYGAPDDIITEETDPVAPPYEIWSYYTFPSTRQQNVKFVYYNPSLTANDFVLLHSTAIGEHNNPRWLVELYNQAPGDINGSGIDATTVRDGFSRNADRYFNDN